MAADNNPPVRALSRAPFDQITFDDLRLLHVCGQQWASLADLTVAQAIEASKGLPLASVLGQAAPVLQQWAAQVAAATLDQRADETKPRSRQGAVRLVTGTGRGSAAEGAES